MADKKTRILLVDDEEDILEFLTYNLQKEGYKVFTALNGLDAIELAESKRPDLIILDIMMPGMDGIDVCRQLRLNPEFKSTLIAFLTARGEDYTEIRALESGGDDYIHKPIKPGVFISRVKAILRRINTVGESENPIVELGDLMIDKEKVLVVVSGKKTDLAKKEFELLVLLASRPGKVFKRTEILNKVWGMDVIVGNRTIDVHIRKLREKIGDHYIKTVKGIGYKFDF